MEHFLNMNTVGSGVVWCRNCRLRTGAPPPPAPGGSSGVQVPPGMEEGEWTSELAPVVADSELGLASPTTWREGGREGGWRESGERRKEQ